MGFEDHKQRHIELHKYLDELVADFITHNQGMPSTTTILQLMKWSKEQMENPTEKE